MGLANQRPGGDGFRCAPHPLSFLSAQRALTDPSAHGSTHAPPPVTVARRPTSDSEPVATRQSITAIQPNLIAVNSTTTISVRGLIASPTTLVVFYSGDVFSCPQNTWQSETLFDLSNAYASRRCRHAVKKTCPN